ncbi:alpha/beta hydrolase [Streptomyces mashuensis]|uniref:Alpha/beta hydrolase n=1 Tax=Streptomyces mashuensis TaxID=33904 RepID=A0A919B2T4_9ACTN|nr:alpha/beta hydrolase [Streptomyces mashuensis]GHF47244.1 alpha/beta hydrolase [Streptomyces mashuensis]
MPIVTVADAQVHYERSGSGPLPRLVLVHGTGSAGAALTWGGIGPRFAADREIVTPDLSGAGNTTDDGAPLTVEGLAAQVIAVIEDSGTGPADLLGFSMGAPVAAAVAALRPDLVRRLVLVAGWAHTDGDPYLRNFFGVWQRLGQQADAETFGRYITMTGFSRDFLRALGNEEVERMVPNLPPTPGTLRHVDLDTRIDIRALLPRVTARTLVVGGTQDITVPVEHSRALHAAVADSTYEEIDAGHVMFFEQPEAFVKVVGDFLAAS